MTKATKAWACGECNTTHPTESGARYCCQPLPSEVWVCSDCGASHETVTEADDCCALNVDCPNCKRQHAEQSLQGAQIAVAGHCDVCNPIYTIDEHHAIQRALEEER